MAERLLAMKVPFIFATGYGDSLHLPEQFGSVPVVEKPYNRLSLQEMLSQLLAIRGA